MIGPSKRRARPAPGRDAWSKLESRG